MANKETSASEWDDDSRSPSQPAAYIAADPDSAMTDTPNSRTTESLSAAETTQFEKALGNLASFLSQHSLALTILWLGLVVVSMVGFSRQKPLWADEVLFREIIALPSLAQIWQALTLGLNTDPPLAHFLTHGLAAWFGTGTLAVRSTAMFGVVLMLLCLFLTLRKYVGSLYALLGVLLPFCTMLVDYGYEARPYGLMYGSFALAIYCWVKAGEGGPRKLVWNIALAVALAAALACHFYAVFALPAFYFGEAVRAARKGRFSPGTVIAIVAASLSLLLYSPIIAGARQFSSAYFEKPSLTSIPGMLERSLDPLAIALFAFLAFVALFATLGVRFARDEKPEESPAFRELAALGLGFLLIPLFAWGAGLVVLKAFTARYVLHGLLGVFVLLPLFADRVFRRDVSLGLALLMACGLPALVFAVQGTKRVFKASARTQDAALIEQALARVDGDLVVSDPHALLELINDSPQLKARCIYLWDRQNEAAYTHQDGFSHLAAAGNHLGLFRAADWNEYAAEHAAFLFLTVPDSLPDGLGWLRARLEADHRYGEIVARPGKYLIVDAAPPAGAASPSPPE